MNKKLLFITILSLLLSSTIILGPVFAQTIAVTKRSDWRPDDKITKLEAAYHQPEEIALVPAYVPQFMWKYDDETLVRSYYYYFATRSSYGDLPFHYLVTPDGGVFETGKYADYMKLDFDSDTNLLVVAVLSKKSDDGLPITNVDSVSSIALQLANAYNIDSNSIFEYTPDFIFNESDGIETISLKKSAPKFALNTVRNFVSKSFDPVEPKYSFTLKNISVPSDKVKEGEKVSVSITLQNSSDRDIFGGDERGLLLTSEKEKSLLYDQASWSTLSGISLLADDERFEKNEEKTFTFTIVAPLAIGAYSEQFVLTYNGDDLGVSTTISLNLENPEGTIIEILDTGAGYLNVRESPPFGEVVTRVLPGEKYIVLESTTGWYKIKTVDDIEGWVSAEYANVISN